MLIDEIVRDLNKKDFAHSYTVFEDGNGDCLTQAEREFLNKFHLQSVLIVYGSLAPSGPNHFKIKHINGKWHKCKIYGTLNKKGWGAELGYYGLKQTNKPTIEKVEAHILISDELAGYWNELDEYEGEDYERILYTYELDDGTIGVGNIYALKK